MKNIKVGDTVLIEAVVFSVDRPDGMLELRIESNGEKYGCRLSPFDVKEVIKPPRPDWDAIEQGYVMASECYPELTYIGRSARNIPQSFIFEAEDGAIVRVSRKWLKKYGSIPT